MSRRVQSAEYGRALFGIALEGGADLAAVGRDFAEFQSLLEAQPALHEALSSPVLPVERKLGIVDEILALAPVTPLAAHVLRLVIRHDHLRLLPDIVRDFEARVRQHQQVVDAEVVTAVPLAPDRQAAIAGRLAEATGKHVRLSTRIDPELLGGVMSRVGSVVYDGSIKRQLELLLEQLTERV